MKKWIFIICLNCFLTTLYAQPDIDVLHYKFEIGITDKSDTVYGRATIQIKLLKFTDHFSLDFTSIQKNGNGMKVIKVTESNHEVDFEQKNDSLIINFFIVAAVGDEKYFTIEYKGIPSDGLIISKNKFGDRTFFADNWPDRAHNWIPCVDDPADKASFEFIITAPSQYQVISNGQLINNEEESPSAQMKVPGLTRTHWKEDIPLSTKIMVIGVAKFAVKEFPDSPANIPVSAWVYPKDSVRGYKNYSVATDIIKFYSSYIGPYPFNKLANVQSTTIYGGMENASAIFYNEASASSIFGAEGLIAHEIAHQWFGDMVSEKKFAHLWLSEGFATYCAHLYTEKKYGRDSMETEMKDDRQQVIDFSSPSENPVVDSISSFRQLLNPNSYQKGSWILHMLRRQLGDSVFHNIIRSFYESYKGKNADTRDFETIAEKVSGKDLKIFFDQWLYNASIPELNIKRSYSTIKKTINITVEQNQKGPVFSFPLELLLKNKAGNPLIKKIAVTKAKETFSIPAISKPHKIEIDPSTSLLFTGRIEESKN